MSWQQAVPPALRLNRPRQQLTSSCGREQVGCKVERTKFLSIALQILSASFDDKRYYTKGYLLRALE